MSISSISSNSDYYQMQQLQSQRAKEMKSIEDAVASGNISVAQSALKTLQASAPTQTDSGINAIGTARRQISALHGQHAASGTSASSSDTSDSDDPMASFFSAIESGDLTSAQTALATLKASAPPPPPPPPGSADGAGDETAQALDTLFEAVKSGDKTKAQAALTALQSSDSYASSQIDTSSDVGKDLEALFAAVKSGDMTTAQSSLQTLGDDVQSAMPPPPPPPGPPPGVSGSNGSSSSDSGSGSASSDLKSLFEAIKSGDMATAKKMLETFKQQLAAMQPSSSGSGSQVSAPPFPVDYAETVAS